MKDDNPPVTKASNMKMKQTQLTSIEEGIEPSEPVTKKISWRDEKLESTADDTTVATADETDYDSDATFTTATIIDYDSDSDSLLTSDDNSDYEYAQFLARAENRLGTMEHTQFLNTVRRI